MTRDSAKNHDSSQALCFKDTAQAMGANVGGGRVPSGDGSHRTAGAERRGRAKKMNLKGLLSIILAAGTPVAAFAQPALPPEHVPAGTGQCFDIVNATPQQQPFLPILLDRCTGRSWMLVKIELTNPTGRPPAAFTYRWFPLAADTSEPSLGTPDLSPKPIRKP